MEYPGHEEPLAQDLFAFWAAMTGGTFVILNWIWQGYLNAISGRIEILEDTTHVGYYINAIMLMISTICLFYAIMAFNDATKSKRFFWKLGFNVTVLGMLLFALGTLGFIVYGFADYDTLPSTVSLIKGIGHVTIHVGALPLGIALLHGKVLLKVSAILFILQTPISVIYFFEDQIHTLISSVFIGGFYGFGWIFIGIGFFKGK